MEPKLNVPRLFGVTNGLPWPVVNRGNAINPNMNYINKVLIPPIPGTLKNLVNRGNLSFYFGDPTNKVRIRVLANLKKAGLNTDSARNLIQKLINEGPTR